MVLETWCLGMNDRVDSNAKVTYAVYNRIGMLLKSLVSVTSDTCLSVVTETRDGFYDVLQVRYKKVIILFRK